MPVQLPRGPLKRLHSQAPPEHAAFYSEKLQARCPAPLLALGVSRTPFAGRKPRDSAFRRPETA
jgi:hypothetical protein